MHRFGPNGLYLLDEPEAALSVRGQMALLARMHELVGQGCQFLVATHSPILTAFPGSRIMQIDEMGMHRVRYDEAELVHLTRAFLDNPQRFLKHLLADGDGQQR
jgi:predicted ATPase